MAGLFDDTPPPMPTVEAPDVPLTEGQQQAYDMFMEFLMKPNETYFVLAGYAGTGKSTLVRKILSELPTVMKTLNMLLVDDKLEYEVYLTATTNKAAEALNHITGVPVSTIQSFLGLVLKKDYETGKTELVPKRDATIQYRKLIFVDEASYIDSSLLAQIGAMTKFCKIVFIGDPAQLTPVKSNLTPVFSQGYPTATLTEVVRQAEGNPIIEVATSFRHTVNTGVWNAVTLDNKHIRHLPRNDFEQEIIKEFDRPDWKSTDSKVLAWTNKCVQAYNHQIRNLVQGEPELNIDDYAVCNSYFQSSKGKVKTDETVQITDMYDSKEYDVLGKEVEINGRFWAFMPNDIQDKRRRINQATKDKNAKLLQYFDNNWIDLRAAYACTINKSQGSTYDKVFIDLDDIKRCNIGNQIARMMYVAVSRARHEVILTGDLV